MDPATGLAVLGAAVGSKEVLNKILGPTADYLGGGLKDWTEKGFRNLGRIMDAARRRLGTAIESDGAIPPRVLKEVLAEGPFCEDELWAEYFGGILASSRSEVPRDDRGASLAALVGRLSTYQVRAHYMFYRLLKTLFDGSEQTVTLSEGRRKLRMYIPLQAFAMGMEIDEKENFEVILGHSIEGLVREGLLGSAYAYGGVEVLRSHGFRGASEPGIMVEPSSVGAELFLWAHGAAGSGPNRLLKRETELVFNVPLKIAPGVRGVESNGPVLDQVLKPRAAEADDAGSA